MRPKQSNQLLIGLVLLGVILGTAMLTSYYILEISENGGTVNYNEYNTYYTNLEGYNLTKLVYPETPNATGNTIECGVGINEYGDPATIIPINTIENNYTIIGIFIQGISNNEVVYMLKLYAFLNETEQFLVGFYPFYGVEGGQTTGIINFIGEEIPANWGIYGIACSDNGGEETFQVWIRYIQKLE